MLYGDRNKMSGLVYRLLHTILTDEGVHTQGRNKHDWLAVMRAIEMRTGISITIYMGAEVDAALRKLHFSKQVAICDLFSGRHSILLTGKVGGWVEAFDPDWHNVRVRREKLHAYIVQPEDCIQCRRGLANVLIDEEYLLIAGRGSRGEFQMGSIASRTLTVMEKRRR